MPIKIGGAKPNAAPAPEQHKAPPTADLSSLGSAPTQENPPAPEQATAAGDATGATPPPANVPNHQTSAGFLMTGKSQQSQVDQVRAVQQLRSKLRGGAREFWLEPGQFAKLVFLDGNVIGENVFDTPMVATHMLQIGGQWYKIICNEHTEGSCIICNSNADNSQPTTMQLFTVINVMPYTIRGGPNRGKTLPARLQLFPANLKTREKLMKRAQTRGGTLAGGLYQFSRSEKQAARTGDDIEFIQTVDLNAVLKKFPMLGTKQDDKGEWKEAPTAVYDYAKVYPVLTNAEIAQMRPDIAAQAGFTAYTAMPGAQAGANSGGFGNDPTQDIDDELPF